MKSFLKNNALSLLFLGLFIVTLAGQFFTGFVENRRNQNRLMRPITKQVSNRNQCQQQYTNPGYYGPKIRLSILVT